MISLGLGLQLLYPGPTFSLFFHFSLIYIKNFFYVTCDILGQIYFFHSFSIPNLLPGCSYNFCIFLPGSLSPLLPSLSYLFLSNFVQALFSQFSVSRDALLLSLEERILDFITQLSWASFPSRTLSHGNLSKRSLKSSLLKWRITSYYLLCCLTNLKLRCLIVTAAQAILFLHIRH